MTQPVKNNTSQAETELLELLEAKEYELKYNKISALFPDEGPYRRELYPKHIKFLNAGAEYDERAFIAANRTGKTLTAAIEITYHLTGEYPKWWKGKRFLNAVDIWAAGISNQSTKEVIQNTLLGDANDIGSGIIPKDKFARKPTKKHGTADAIETIYVQHKSGDLSRLTFKSYEQGRESFQGTKKQVIWLDEEPRDKNIYTECLTRTMDDHNPGIIICTFTPLFGMSDIVETFLPDRAFPKDGVDSRNPQKFVINVDWDDVPHLNAEQKKKILASYAPHERDARSRGIPSLGSGAIYPYVESDIVVDTFHIPPDWPRVYALDIGWKKTAAVWGAIDPNTNTVYLYAEYYQGRAAPAVHASTIKARGGDWMMGVVDPAAGGSNALDGRRFIDIYEQEGLRLIPADNSVEAGIAKTAQMLESGQMKVMRHLQNWITEYRGYCRDENGKILKKNDHLMDAMRYLVMSGLEYAEELPDYDSKWEQFREDDAPKQDEFTGY